MSMMASQITSLTIVYSTIYSATDQRKHQSSASMTFSEGNSPVTGEFLHKGPVTLKMFPFDDFVKACEPYKTLYYFIIFLSIH